MNFTPYGVDVQIALDSQGALHVLLESRKYDWYIDEITHSLMCKRHGSPWRASTGDKATAAMFMACIDLLLLQVACGDRNLETLP